MLNRNKTLFCYFSGYASNDVELTGYQYNGNNGTLTIDCINQGSHIIKAGDYIQLNGVLFEVTKKTNGSFSALTTYKLLDHAVFNPTALSTKLTLGVLTEWDAPHNCFWMLQPSVSGVVVYRGYSLLDGHEYTLKLNFEASSKFADAINENQHVGLAGVSLTAKEVTKTSHLVKFSIYCGKDTRDKTNINQLLPLDTFVNFTAC